MSEAVFRCAEVEVLQEEVPKKEPQQHRDGGPEKGKEKVLLKGNREKDHVNQDPNARMQDREPRIGEGNGIAPSDKKQSVERKEANQPGASEVLELFVRY